MTIKIMNPGDRILTITDNFIAIEHTSGEVDLYRISIDRFEKKIDTKGKLTIGYIEPSTEITTTKVNGVTITTF